MPTNKFGKQSGMITAAPIANSVVTGSILDGTIAAADMGALSVTAAKLNADVITGSTGLAGGAGAPIEFAPTACTAADVSVANDSIVIIDANSTPANAPRKESITDLVSAVAGTASSTALTASSGVLTVAPTEVTVDVAADSLILRDATDSKVHRDTIADVVTGVAGTATGTGLVATNGVLAVRPGSLTAATVDVAADSIMIVDANDTNLPKLESVAHLASGMAGTGIIAASGTLNEATTGSFAVGTILFSVTSDATKFTIGTTDYAYDVAPDATAGEWAYGASASESATNLTAAINQLVDSPYAATANTDTVHIYSKAVGTAGNAAIVKTGGVGATTIETPMVGGAAVATRTWGMFTHTVTANDIDTADHLNIPLPFAPTMFTVSVRSSTGAPVYTTNLFTIETTPNRIKCVEAGATNLTAGDIITVIAHM